MIMALMSSINLVIAMIPYHAVTVRLDEPSAKAEQLVG